MRTQKNKSKGNGEGTIYYNKTKEKWVGQYVIEGKRKSVYQRKKESVSDFKKRFNKIMNDINQGTYLEKSVETVITIAEQYINVKHEDGITSGRSYKREIETLEAIKKSCSNFCNLPIQKVTIKNIENAKKNIRQYANSVIDKIWKLLTKSFDIACSPSRKILMYNIMRDETLKKPISIKETKMVKALTHKEFERLNKILDNEERNHKYRNIVKMQGISGMRIGEVLARSRNDYDKEKNLFYVYNTVTQDENYKTILGKHTKTYNKKLQIDRGQRYLPLNNEIFNGLEEIIKEESTKRISNIYNLLFWDYEKNTFITTSEINSWLYRLNKKYNICKEKLTTHRLRHTAITYWNERDIPLRLIQYLAGHVEGSDVTDEVYIDISLDFVINKLKEVG